MYGWRATGPSEGRKGEASSSAWGDGQFARGSAVAGRGLDLQDEEAPIHVSSHVRPFNAPATPKSAPFQVGMSKISTVHVSTFRVATASLPGGLPLRGAGSICVWDAGLGCRVDASYRVGSLVPFGFRVSGFKFEGVFFEFGV